jgi:hypothetical protein
VTRTTADYDDDGDAADTLRFARLDFDAEAPTDPDATGIYDLRDAETPRYVGHSSSPLSSLRRRRQLKDTRENVLRLREAVVAGWDIGPELAYEERRLADLEAADRGPTREMAL